MTLVEAITRERWDAYFELSFSPSSALVPTVRRFVSEFYGEVLADLDLASRLTVAAHELLQNSVTYSCDGNSILSIGVRSDQAGVDVAISTRNEAREADIADAVKIIDELARATDVTAHYQGMMRRTAKRVRGSGLGLGRICAEAEMSLSYVLEGDTMHVHARARYERRRP